MKKAYKQTYLNLKAAVEAVYNSAHWSADRPVDDKKLWENLRDAAGITPGNSPKPLVKQAI